MADDSLINEQTLARVDSAELTGRQNSPSNHDRAGTQILEQDQLMAISRSSRPNTFICTSAVDPEPKTIDSSGEVPFW